MSRPLTALFVLVLGCARQQGSTTPVHEQSEVHQLEEMRITARLEESGEYSFDSYDADRLFTIALGEYRAGRCPQAVEMYDRIVDEFPSSRYRSPSLYNAALCLKESGENQQAITRFERLIRELPDSNDVKHASFQLLELYLEEEHTERGLTLADVTLARTDLSSDERVEAMARKAQLLLTDNQRPEARRHAESTLSYTRTRQEEDRVYDNYFVAAANFVLAETIRLQAEDVVPPPGGVAVQRPALERRAQLILAAQREYFDTIRQTHAHWAAAAGYKIGAMYDSFWDTMMSAPVPPPSSDLGPEEVPVYEQEYRVALARLVKPLIRHSIRYWELTLLMVERTGVESEWTTRIRSDLDRARVRLLEQPEGPEGIDAVGRIRQSVEERLEDQAQQGSEEQTPPPQN